MRIGKGTEPLYSSFSKRYGAFFLFFSEHTIYSGDGRKGAGPGEKGDRIGERVREAAFQLLYKPSEPSLSRPLVISEHRLHTRCKRKRHLLADCQIT